MPAGSPASHTSGCRFDSSLGMLTKKFLKLVDDTLDGVLDLNQAAIHLNVSAAHVEGRGMGAHWCMGLQELSCGSGPKVAWRGMASVVHCPQKRRGPHTPTHTHTVALLHTVCCAVL